MSNNDLAFQTVLLFLVLIAFCIGLMIGICAESRIEVQEIKPNKTSRKWLLHNNK